MPETRALVLVGDYDVAVRTGAQEIGEWLAPLPAEQRDVVTLSSDDHGEPALLADHFVPLTNGLDVSLDALDWYGTWELTDALMACAFDGEWCEVALGNPPEQRFMGTWSDGAPVQALVVSDEPAWPVGGGRKGLHQAPGARAIDNVSSRWIRVLFTP